MAFGITIPRACSLLPASDRMSPADARSWPASAALVALRRGGFWRHYCGAFSEVARQFVTLSVI